MSVPKTPVNQDDSIGARNHQIRTTGELLIVQPVSHTEAADDRADDTFRSRVASSNAPHQLRSLQLRQPVRHVCYPG